MIRSQRKISETDDCRRGFEEGRVTVFHFRPGIIDFMSKHDEHGVMARADDTALIDLFEEFYQSYYQEDLSECVNECR